MKSQEQEEASKIEIVELKKEQVMFIIEKVQLWDTRARLEKVVSDTYQEVLVMEEDLDVLAKAQKLGQIVPGFKKDIVYLEVLLNPSMLPKVVDACKSTMKDSTMHLEDREKEVKEIIDAATQFWGSVVQGE